MTRKLDLKVLYLETESKERYELLKCKQYLIQMYKKHTLKPIDFQKLKTL